MPHELKSSNPKDALGANKLPYHLWPEAATALGSLGLLEGALKYGRSNWRAHEVLATTYGAAAIRHIFQWLNGADRTTDSRNLHLANALACLGIIADALANDALVDDRNFGDPAKLEAWLAELTKEVPRLRDTFKEFHPHHYTVQDNVQQAGNGIHQLSPPTSPKAVAAAPREDEQSVYGRDRRPVVLGPEGGSVGGIQVSVWRQDPGTEPR